MIRNIVSKIVQELFGNNVGWVDVFMNNAVKMAAFFGFRSRTVFKVQNRNFLKPGSGSGSGANSLG